MRRFGHRWWSAVLRLIAAVRRTAAGAGPALKFDRDFYLRRYPDIKEAGLDPYAHFLRHGRAEGRTGAPPEFRTIVASGPLDERRPNVLLVSHEASRTGAPILAWNMCLELQERFNVVVLLLGPGVLVEHFAAAASVVVGPYGPLEIDAVSISYVIDELFRRYQPRFAVVNSIASRSVLAPLAARSIPSVLLVHEFYSFYCSKHEMIEAVSHASRVVFSTALTRSAADLDRAAAAGASAPVVAQGKSRIPGAAAAGVRTDHGEVLALKRLARRAAPNAGSLVILGVGTIEFRKGVDLFVATAAQVRRVAPQSDVVFAWVGPVPPHHRQYADLLVEQVARSGLEHSVFFLGEAEHLEELYAQSDIFFLSARLDPLPNVALDALTAGTPVICFEGATGLPEFLATDPQLAGCVVPYLDIDAAARRIVELGAQPEHRRSIGSAARSLSTEHFAMRRYVEQLIAIASSVAGDRALFECDLKALNSANDFVAGFFLPDRGATMSRGSALRAYLESGRHGVFGRKPAPGFDPVRYGLEKGWNYDKRDPFAQYLVDGRPSGPWQEKVLDLSRPGAGEPHARMRVAVHLHAYYVESIGDLLRPLADSKIDCDVFVSVGSEDEVPAIRTELARYGYARFDIRPVPNRGRDIGPMITEFGSALQTYDLIGHFHTKKSNHVAARQFARDWVVFLIENLLGGRCQSAAKILSAFAHDEELGMVFADDPHLIGWDANLPFAKALARQLGIGTLPVGTFPFPVGNMFWARPKALDALWSRNLGWDDYPEEPLPIDGTILHAVERLLPLIVREAGYSRMVTYVPGITR